MMKNKLIFLSSIKLFFLNIFIFLILIINPLSACPSSPSFLILDYNSGKILEGSNEHVRMQPASLTKLMTLYILFESLEENKITFLTPIKVSKKAATLPSSKLWLKPQQPITVKDAINALIVKSANDVAYAVAETLGNGNEKNFVALMNKKVKQMGLKNTHFANATGLTHPNQYSSAYDLTILARFIMFRFPQYYHLFSQKTFKWGNYVYRNTNQLLEYSNVDGLKTGYTAAAGYNLLVSSEINSVRIIITSLGNKTANDRNDLVKQLVNNGLVIAQNFLFTNVSYKDPPQEVIAANNFLKPLNNFKLASNFSYVDINISNYNNIENNNLINTALEDYMINSQEIQLASYTPYTQPKEPTLIKEYTIEKVTPSVTKINNKKYFLQLGVFSNANSAKKVGKQVLSLEPTLQNSNLKIETFNKKNNTFYRVRLVNLSSKEANLACSNLKNKNIACFIGVI